MIYAKYETKKNVLPMPLPILKCTGFDSLHQELGNFQSVQNSLSSKITIISAKINYIFRNSVYSFRVI